MSYISILTRATTFSGFRNLKTQFTSFFKSPVIARCGENHQLQKLQVAKFCSRSIDVNTNVGKDVILFKYENPKFFKMMNVFALCQFAFWNYLSYFAYTTLKDAPVPSSNEDAPWYRRINLGDNKFRNAITGICFLIGYGILASTWMFTLRSVRFLILRKGGQQVSIVTYGPFNKNRIMNVPLKNLSAQESRQSARVQLPVKVQNKAFYYILDMRGEFLNTKLFDHTAGLKRRIDY